MALSTVTVREPCSAPPQAPARGVGGVGVQVRLAYELARAVHLDLHVDTPFGVRGGETGGELGARRAQARAGHSVEAHLHRVGEARAEAVQRHPRGPSGGAHGRVEVETVVAVSARELRRTTALGDGDVDHAGPTRGGVDHDAVAVDEARKPRLHEAAAEAHLSVLGEVGAAQGDLGAAEKRPVIGHDPDQHRRARRRVLRDVRGRRDIARRPGVARPLRRDACVLAADAPHPEGHPQDKLPQSLATQCGHWLSRGPSGAQPGVSDPKRPLRNRSPRDLRPRCSRRQAYAGSAAATALLRTLTSTRSRLASSRARYTP